MLTNAVLAQVRALLILTGETRIVYAQVLDQNTVSPNVLAKRTDAEDTLARQEYSRLRYHFPKNGGYTLSRTFSRRGGFWIITAHYNGSV